MTKAWRGLIFALLLVFPAIVPAFPQEGITGVASVIDGDTIEIHQRIRGIDAPESSQLCVLPTGDINIWSGDFDMPWDWRAQHRN